MSVLVSYKGAALRQLDAGTLSLLTVGRYMEADVEVWNYGPETAVVACPGRQTITIAANDGRRLLTADTVAPGNITINLRSSARKAFVPRGSSGLITSDGKRFITD